MPMTPEQTQQEFQRLRSQLNNEQFRKRVAAHVPREFRSTGYVDRLIEGIFVAVRGSWNAKEQKYLLLEADRASLFRAAEEAAKRQLTIGENVSWLVPYRGQVQFQIGYRGCLILARRSGVVSRIYSHPVFENDRCTIRLGTDPVVEHEPALSGGRGQFIGCYAVAWVRSHDDAEESEPEIEWMGVEELNRLKNMSPGKFSDAWKNHEIEMHRKAPLKRLYKRLPVEKLSDLDDMEDRMKADIEGVGEPAEGMESVAQVEHQPDQEFEPPQPDEREAETVDRETGEVAEPQVSERRGRSQQQPAGDGGLDFGG